MQGVSPLDPFSPQAQAISALFWFVMVVAGVILLVVTGLVVYIVIRFRHREGRAPSTREGNTALEITWTAIPLLIVGAIFVLTVRTMHTVQPPAGDRTPDVRVVAHQWWWEVHYPSGVTTANEIHVPVGRTLLFRLTSADVVHDFWVPQLARKMDAIPGHPNDFWMKVEKPGVYHGTCAEYCGVGHALMRILVVAQTPKEFEAWEQAQLTPHPPPATAEARQGRQLLEQLTCANCHTVRGSSASGRVGPDLTHLADRRTLASGAAENTHDQLTQWLKDPNSIKPGSHMPNLQLSDARVKALVAYLEE